MSIKRKDFKNKNYLDQINNDDEDSMVELSEIAIISSSKASLRYRSVSEINASRTENLNRKDLIDITSKPLISQTPTEESKQIIDYETDLPQEPETFYTKVKDQLCMIKGIMYGMLSAFVFCLSHIVIKRAKYMTGSEHTTVRYFVNFIIMFIVLRYKKIPILGPIKQRKLLVIRGFLGCTALITIYFGLLLINPSDITTVSHSSIIITAILSRIFLKEKLTIAHFSSVILTIIGVILISKPSALFPNDTVKNNSSSILILDNNNTIDIDRYIKINCSQINNEIEFKNKFGSETTNFSSNLNCYIKKKFYSDFENYRSAIGISLCLYGSFTSGIIYLILKKLSNSKVHWAATTIYVSWFGIPLSLFISVLLIYFKMAHKNFAIEKKEIPMDIFYSICASFLSITGQVLLNIAMKYEDATKLAITKTIDVFFAFILQYIFLNIKVDLLSVMGACSIIIGTFFVLVFKLLDNKYESFKCKQIENENSIEDKIDKGDLNKADMVQKKQSTKYLILKIIFFKI